LPAKRHIFAIGRTSAHFLMNQSGYRDLFGARLKTQKLCKNHQQQTGNHVTDRRADGCGGWYWPRDWVSLQRLAVSLQLLEPITT